MRITTAPRLLAYSLLVLGLSMALLCMGLGMFLFLLEFLGHQQHPYMALLTLGLLPLGFLAGLGIAAIGLVLLRRTAHQALSFPVLDLNDRGRRQVFVILFFCVMMVVCGSAFGSYEAYDYTDSTQFCGLTCHTVMQPEYEAHDQSPHARVACVECHVGSGASWYVQAKVNGLKQLVEVVRGTYPRPIPVPVENLRPAQDTCMNCHWSKKYHGNLRKEFAYFQSDDKNTREDVVMLLKIGGDDPGEGPPGGIHWHMNLSHQVTYATLDPKRETIPWVQVKSADGSVHTYRSTDSKFTDADLPKAEKRVMDCTECHNRPAHIFHNPADELDRALADGLINPTLPYIKEVGVIALEGNYQTQDQAKAALAAAVRQVYADKHKEVAAARGSDIEQAIPVLQGIYTRNYFPEMKADWKAFPNHLDHMHTTGCFRCHDGNHKDEQGHVLTKDCNACHTIVMQRVNGKVTTATEDKGLEFAHPTEGDGWKDNDCTDCHGPDAK